MPEWLLKKDDYTPSASKDAFIDKSILSIIDILSKFRGQAEAKSNKININAVVKLISILLMIVLVSLARNFAFVLFANVVMLVAINFLTVKEMKYVLKVSFVVAAFTFIILLPSIMLGYGNNSLMISLKVLFTVAMVNILACTTEWREFMLAFKALKVPDLFIFVLDITIKYIIILGEFSLNMVYALKLRSVGKSAHKSSSLSGVIGTMFIKSKELSEEMYDAMECRGFTGEYRVYKRFKFQWLDYLFIIIDIAFFIIYFYFDRL